MKQKLFCVYGHYKDGVLKYVGSGSPNRPYAFSQRQKKWREVFKESNPEVRIFSVHLEESEAREEEARIINSNTGLVNTIRSAGFNFKEISHEDQMSLAALRSGPAHWSYEKERDIETKRKISETKKANPTKYWLGKKRSEIDPETMKKLWAAGSTPEARAKQANSKRGKKLSEEHKRKISEAGKGRIVSEETRKKISEANKGRGGVKGRKHTESSKEKMSTALKERWQDPAYRKKMSVKKKGWTTSKAKAVKCLETSEVFRSAKEAAEKLSCDAKHIQACCVGRRKTHGGYRFQYHKEGS
jgi:hypothetical protein